MPKELLDKGATFIPIGGAATSGPGDRVTRPPLGKSAGKSTGKSAWIAQFAMAPAIFAGSTAPDQEWGRLLGVAGFGMNVAASR